MFYPIYVNLKGKKVLVIGGGAVAQRKIRNLNNAGACIVCVSQEVKPAIRSMKKVTLINERFRVAHVRTIKPFMIINATGDRSIDTVVRKVVEQGNILYNSVDTPDACNFIVPALYKEKDLLIAVSTQGKAPFMAAFIRDALSHMIKPEWVEAIRIFGKKRKKIKSLPWSHRIKVSFLKKIVSDSKVIRLLRGGKSKEAAMLIDKKISSF